MNSKAEKNGWRNILLVYGIAVIGYLLFAKCFTIPVHVGVDEELYISMAKTFHYKGYFAKGNEILDYTCVLYSMILSLAYYFYSPENIVFGFRIIGICIMLSSIIPVYLLSKKLLNDEKKGFVLCVFTCILPSMMNVIYCMQEVLSYPLFLWTIYFVSKEVYWGKIAEISSNTWIVIAFSTLCYFTKTYMIFIPIVYCMVIVFCGYMEKKHVWKKVVLIPIVYLLLLKLGNELIYCINDGIEGVNHYSSQFANLFPITMETVVAAVTCSVFYVAAILFYWGVLPVILPIANWEKHDKKDRLFILFILASFIVLVVEIVVSIVLTEEGNVLLPHKVLYRYFQILEIPLFVIFVKYYEKYRVPRWMWVSYLFVLSTLGGYYVYIGNGQRTAIVDAPLFLLMENINKYVIPQFNVLVCIGSSFLLLWVYYLIRKGKVTKVLSKYLLVTMMGIGIFFIINLVQLPLYTNVIAQGRIIEEDAIKIAHYCESNQAEEKEIYFVHTSDLFYERAINAYLKQEVIFLTEEEAKEVVYENAVIICSEQYKLEHSQKIDIGTKTVQVLEMNIIN